MIFSYNVNRLKSGGKSTPLTPGFFFTVSVLPRVGGLRFRSREDGGVGQRLEKTPFPRRKSTCVTYKECRDSAALTGTGTGKTSLPGTVAPAHNHRSPVCSHTKG